MTKTEIVAEAIKELYYKSINKTQDADIVGRISMTVDDKVNASMHQLQSKVDQILFLINKLDLGTKVLYRSPSVLPPPKNTKQLLKGNYGFMCQYEDPDFETVWGSVFDLENLMIY